ncbi:MAG TPA: response regulator [Desulfuromonadaceae bacterium]
MAKMKILVVEDEWIIANDIKDSLIGMGYMVTGLAASCEEALARIEECEPDLVLMDIVLKGDKNGIDTVREIRARYDIPVIYLTAYDNQLLVDQAKLTDNHGYLLKPFKDRELHIAIEFALHRRGGYQLKTVPLL